MRRRDQEFADHVGRCIRRARHQAGISQEELAQRAGLRAATISAAETGKHLPQTVTAVLICRALNRPLSDLLDGIRWIEATEKAPGHWHSDIRDGERRC